MREGQDERGTNPRLLEIVLGDVRSCPASGSRTTSPVATAVSRPFMTTAAESQRIAGSCRSFGAAPGPTSPPPHPRRALPNALGDIVEAPWATQLTQSRGIGRILIEQTIIVSDSDPAFPFTNVQIQTLLNQWINGQSCTGPEPFRHQREFRAGGAVANRRAAALLAQQRRGGPAVEPPHSLRPRTGCSRCGSHDPEQLRQPGQSRAGLPGRQYPLLLLA